MPKQIKLMLDYGCSPLWNLVPIEPEDLPLSAELVQQLHDLAKEFEEGFNWDNPAATVPRTQEQLQELDDKLLNLALKLQVELTNEYEVTYFSEQLAKIMPLK